MKKREREKEREKTPGDDMRKRITTSSIDDHCYGKLTEPLPYQVGSNPFIYCLPALYKVVLLIKLML